MSQGEMVGEDQSTERLMVHELGERNWSQGTKAEHDLPGAGSSLPCASTISTSALVNWWARNLGYKGGSRRLRGFLLSRGNVLPHCHLESRVLRQGDRD